MDPDRLLRATRASILLKIRPSLFDDISRAARPRGMDIYKSASCQYVAV